MNKRINPTKINSLNYVSKLYFKNKHLGNKKCNPVLLCCVSSYQSLNSDLVITITNILNIENCVYIKRILISSLIVIKMFYR